MKKPLLSLILITILLSSLFVIPTTGATVSNIKIGDYIKMGTYNGEPIMWRCISFEKIKGYEDDGTPIVDSTNTKTEYEEGYLPLIIADRILCFKAFDAAGENQSSSHGRGRNNIYSGRFRKKTGSSYWGDSNIRCWLNSNAGSGEVVWTCGNPPDASHVYDGENPYADEAGFLTNFYTYELAAIQSVSHKILLDRAEYDNMAPYGSTQHIFNNCEIYEFSNIVQNYSTAYAENATDMFFLLDVQQICTFFYNDSFFGNTHYYEGIPADNCLENTNFKAVKIINDKKWSTWLLSPSDGARDYGGIRYIYPDYSTTSKLYAGGLEAYYGSCGIRPIFYIKPSFLHNQNEDGTYNNPYTVANNGEQSSDDKTPHATIKELNIKDDIVSMDIPLQNINSNANAFIALYDNDGTLVKVKQQELQKGDDGLKTEVNLNTEYPKQYTAKIFVWGDNLAPVCEPFKRQLNFKYHFVTDAVLESSHSFDNGLYNEMQTYTYPGCKSITVTFSKDTDVEEDSDYILIYNKLSYDYEPFYRKGEWDIYTGSELAGKTVTIPGDTLKIQLTVKHTYPRTKWYGYKTERIVVNM